jgi:hypothetical protein
MASVAAIIDPTPDDRADVETFEHSPDCQLPTAVYAANSSEFPQSLRAPLSSKRAKTIPSGTGTAFAATSLLPAKQTEMGSLQPRNSAIKKLKITNSPDTNLVLSPPKRNDAEEDKISPKPLGRRYPGGAMSHFHNPLSLAAKYDGVSEVELERSLDIATFKQVMVARLMRRQNNTPMSVRATTESLLGIPSFFSINLTIVIV